MPAYACPSRTLSFSLTEPAGEGSTRVSACGTYAKFDVLTRACRLRLAHANPRYATAPNRYDRFTNPCRVKPPRGAVCGGGKLAWGNPPSLLHTSTNFSYMC